MRNKENERVEKDKRDYLGNIVNLIVGKSNGFELNIYYHLIYLY